jgi:malate dehydrogenase
VIVVVSNPLDAMCHVALEASDFRPEKVIGMGGALDSARLRRLIADTLGVSVENTQALVMGNHGPKMAPMPRYCTVAGIPISQLLPADRIKTLCGQTVRLGDDIVRLLKTGSAYYAPAACAIEIAESIIKDKHKILPCAALLQGHFGHRNIFLGVPVKLGRGGIEEIVEIELTVEEKAQLDASAEAVLELRQALTVLGL